MAWPLTAQALLDYEEIFTSRAISGIVFTQVPPPHLMSSKTMRQTAVNALLRARERGKARRVRQYFTDPRNGCVLFSNESCAATFQPRASGQCTCNALLAWR